MVRAKENKNEKDSFLSGALALTLSVIIVKIIGFIYKLPLSHILGDEGMGYFNSAYSIFAFFYMLCSGGIPRAISITVTEAGVSGSKNDIRKILSISLKVFVSVGFLFTAALMIFSDFFAGMIGSSLSSFSLFCIAPSLTFVSASGVLRGYLNGVGKVKSIAISEVLEGCIKFIFGLTLALFAVKRGADAPIVSAYTILGVTLGSLFSSLFLFVSYKNAKNEEKTEQNEAFAMKNSEVIKKILKISIPITLSSAIMGISNIIDLGLIMKRLVSIGLSTEEAVALFGNFTTLAVPMMNLVVALMTPLATASMPHLTREFTLGRTKEYFDLCENVFLITGIFVLPISMAYLFFSEEILMLLFSDTSAKIAAPLLSLLAPSIIFLPMLTMVNTVLESSFHPKIPLISMTVGALFKLFVAYILIGEIGIMGAPVSTSVCYGIALVISSGLMCRLLNVKFSVFKILFLPLFASFLVIGGGYIMYNYFSVGSFVSLKFLIFACILAIIYLLMVCIFMRKRISFVLKFVKIAKNKDI